jgi:predicted nucleic acid-binding protein
VIVAVFDCGVVASAFGWRGNPRFCLDLVYAGQALLCVTGDVWQEYADTIPRILAEEKRPVDAEQELARLLKLAHFVDPAPLGKRRSRDVADDRYLAAALGAGATCVVTNDRDLLVLGKPFGVAMLTPLEFIKLARSAE